MFKGITIVDVNEIAANEALKSIQELFDPNMTLFVKADVSNMEELRRAYDQTVQKFNNLDIVIKCAGICDDSNWQKEVAINVVSFLSFKSSISSTLHFNNKNLFVPFRERNVEITFKN